MILESSLRPRRIRACSMPNTCELWQAHARRSFEAACRSAHGECDTVRLLRARRWHPLRESAGRSSLALALCRANDLRTMRKQP